MTAIYLIMHNATGRCYIGRDKHYPRRINRHKRGQGRCKYIRRAIQHYGIHAFTYTIIQEVPDDCAIQAEEYWIAYFEGYTHGFNLTPSGNGFLSGEAHPLYRIPNPELSERNQQRNLTNNPNNLPKVRKQRSEWMRQRNLTDNPMKRPKVAESRKGSNHPNTLENRQKREGIEQLKLF